MAITVYRAGAQSVDPWFMGKQCEADMLVDEHHLVADPNIVVELGDLSRAC